MMPPLYFSDDSLNEVNSFSPVDSRALIYLKIKDLLNLTKLRPTSDEIKLKISKIRPHSLEFPVLDVIKIGKYGLKPIKIDFSLVITALALQTIGVHEIPIILNVTDGLAWGIEEEKPTTLITSSGTAPIPTTWPHNKVVSVSSFFDDLNVILRGMHDGPIIHGAKNHENLVLKGFKFDVKSVIVCKSLYAFIQANECFSEAEGYIFYTDSNQWETANFLHYKTTIVITESRPFKTVFGLYRRPKNVY